MLHSLKKSLIYSFIEKIEIYIYMNIRETFLYLYIETFVYAYMRIYEYMIYAHVFQMYLYNVFYINK